MVLGASVGYEGCLPFCGYRQDVLQRDQESGTMGFVSEWMAEVYVELRKGIYTSQRLKSQVSLMVCCVTWSCNVDLCLSKCPQVLIVTLALLAILQPDRGRDNIHESAHERVKLRLYDFPCLSTWFSAILIVLGRGGGCDDFLKIFVMFMK